MVSSFKYEMKVLSPRLPNSCNPSNSGVDVVLIVVTKRRSNSDFCCFNESTRVKPDNMSKIAYKNIEKEINNPMFCLSESRDKGTITNYEKLKERASPTVPSVVNHNFPKKTTAFFSTVSSHNK